MVNTSSSVQYCEADNCSRRSNLETEVNSSFCLSGMVHTGNESLQDWLRDVNMWNNLGFRLCAVLSVCYMVVISDERMKSEIEVSADGCVVVEH